MSHVVDGDGADLFRLKAQLQDSLARERDLVLLVSQQRHEIAHLHGLVSELQLSKALSSGTRSHSCFCGSEDQGSDNGSLVSNGSSHQEDVEAVIVGMKRLRVEAR